MKWLPCINVLYTILNAGKVSESRDRVGPGSIILHYLVFSTSMVGGKFCPVLRVETVEVDEVRELVEPVYGDRSPALSRCAGRYIIERIPSVPTF